MTDDDTVTLGWVGVEYVGGPWDGQFVMQALPYEPPREIIIPSAAVPVTDLWVRENPDLATALIPLMGRYRREGRWSEIRITLAQQAIRDAALDLKAWAKADCERKLRAKPTYYYWIPEKQS